MFIQTEDTPNPNVIKFIPNHPVLREGTFEINLLNEASINPFLSNLFTIAGVTNLFLSTDFISVTKSEDVEWSILKPQILAVIMEHYLQHDCVNIEVNRNFASDSSTTDDPIVNQIREIIDTRVRPAVAQDGGDIIFDHFDDGIVYVRLQGACSGCPSSSATLKSGIENMLQHYVPEVKMVTAI